jgi:hypothetical protein
MKLMNKEKILPSKKLLRVIFLTIKKKKNILKLIILKYYAFNVIITRTCFMLDF